MFLDIGLGIFVAIATAYLFHIDLFIYLLGFSILFALLPDADFLYFYPKRHDTKYDHKHRDIIHFPLLYLPFGTFLIWITLGNIWALSFFLSSLGHFIHDSIGIGWGIKWLYPFSKNNYAFFYLYSGKIKKGLRKLVFSFNEKDLIRYTKEHGDANWVKNIYYKWHPVAVVEFGLFLFSLLMLVLYFKGVLPNGN